MRTYTPRVNDYVKWKGNEGWVYYVDEEYITIEVGVKCKDDMNISACPIHQKYHTLVVCYSQNWGELEYIKSRDSVYDNER